MTKSRWFLAGVCVTGCLAFIWSLSWFAGKLFPEDHPGRLAYAPEGEIPPVDLEAVQRGWPNNLADQGERNRLVAYLHDTKGTAPQPTAIGSGEAEPEQPPDLGTLLASADATEGEAKARACVSCHDFTSGGPDRIGPNLWGVVGRDVASQRGFSYSGAMQSHGGKWSYDQLFEFLASPARSIPGTKMTFAGMRRPEDRAAVIRYLATLGGNAPPLPQPQSGAVSQAAIAK
ncbi:MAG: cytochrome C [Sphingomonadales bacterium BRH_c42]|nr:MAG: cytochrome C [Sphingomonadales bacterium BRH_c42]